MPKGKGNPQRKQLSLACPRAMQQYDRQRAAPGGPTGDLTFPSACSPNHNSEMEQALNPNNFQRHSAYSSVAEATPSLVGPCRHLPERERIEKQVLQQPPEGPLWHPSHHPGIFMVESWNLQGQKSCSLQANLPLVTCCCR